METHKNRIENRLSPIPNLILPGWEKVQNREYQAWQSEVFRIDTAGKTITQSINELLIFIKLHK